MQTKKKLEDFFFSSSSVPLWLSLKCNVELIEKNLTFFSLLQLKDWAGKEKVWKFLIFIRKLFETNWFDVFIHFIRWESLRMNTCAMTIVKCCERVNYNYLIFNASFGFEINWIKWNKTDSFFCLISSDYSGIYSGFLLKFNIGTIINNLLADPALFLFTLMLSFG